MLALIKREFLDGLAVLVGGTIYVLIWIVVLVTLTIDSSHRPPLSIPEPMIEFLVSLCISIPLFFILLGTVQGYIDKNRKVYTFLCTLAATRHRLFTARIIFGLSLILWMVLLVAATYAALLVIYPPLMPYDVMFPVKMLLTLLLLSVTGFFLGTQWGWARHWFFTVCSAILLLAIILCIIVIKSFHWQSWILLSTIAAAALIRSWQKFMTEPL